MEHTPVTSKGFTLIEALVYTAIFSLFVVTLSSFSESMNVARIRDQNVSEVNDQGSQAIRVITETVRAARAIGTPGTSSTSTTLSLTTDSTSTNPTIFSASAGVLYITEGTGVSIPLTNRAVTVSDLLFMNLSHPATPGVIRVQFTLNATAGSSSPQKSYNADFYGGAAIR